MALVGKLNLEGIKRELEAVRAMAPDDTLQLSPPSDKGMLRAYYTKPPPAPPCDEESSPQKGTHLHIDDIKQELREMRLNDTTAYTILLSECKEKVETIDTRRKAMEDKVLTALKEEGERSDAAYISNKIAEQNKQAEQRRVGGMRAGTYDAETVFKKSNELNTDVCTKLESIESSLRHLRQAVHNTRTELSSVRDRTRKIGESVCDGRMKKDIVIRELKRRIDTADGSIHMLELELPSMQCKETNLEEEMHELKSLMSRRKEADDEARRDLQIIRCKNSSLRTQVAKENMESDKRAKDLVMCVGNIPDLERTTTAVIDSEEKMNSSAGLYIEELKKKLCLERDKLRILKTTPVLPKIGKATRNMPSFLSCALQGLSLSPSDRISDGLSFETLESALPPSAPVPLRNALRTYIEKVTNLVLMQGKLCLVRERSEEAENVVAACDKSLLHLEESIAEKRAVREALKTLYNAEIERGVVLDRTLRAVE